MGRGVGGPTAGGKGSVSHGIGTDSEYGCLRSVLVHRPGPELSRVTPRTRNQLCFAGTPWLAKAQQEHDALTRALAGRGTEVVDVAGLLRDVLAIDSARDEAIAAVLSADLGADLVSGVRAHLEALQAGDLAAVLVAGLTRHELRSGQGLVYELLDPRDFVISPLPNLVFTGDASRWIGDQAVVAGLAGPRRVEAALMAIIYDYHPRFAGLRRHYAAAAGQLEGGDVVLLGPGVVAIGVGQGTTAAAAEQLARHLLAAGTAHTVLAVPAGQQDQAARLDQICTVVDHATVMMAPAIAYTLTALTITVRGGDLRVCQPRPFLQAAAAALDVDALTLIGTGIDGQADGGDEWDDGCNALAIGGRLVICHDRSVHTNARLAAAGFEVLTVPHGELGGLRGGPRGRCLPLVRDPVPAPDRGERDGLAGDDLTAPRRARAAPEDQGGQAAQAAEEACRGAGQSRRAGELTPAR